MDPKLSQTCSFKLRLWCYSRSSDKGEFPALGQLPGDKGHLVIFEDSIQTLLIQEPRLVQTLVSIEQAKLEAGTYYLPY